MRKVIKLVRPIFIAYIFSMFIYGCHDNRPINLSEMIDQTAKELKSVIDERLDSDNIAYMMAGDSAFDWIMMTLALSQINMEYDDYLNALEEYVINKYESEGYLHRIKATEYHRIALTMLALGGNPSSIEYQGGVIDLIGDGTFRFHLGSPGSQGANGLIYALLILDSMNYRIPENEKYNREILLEELLTYQQADGGFCLDKSLGSDIDITSMALQALAPYKNQPQIGEAIRKSLIWLSEEMTDSGTFISYGNENAESCAQVVLALCALEIDPEESEMFQKEFNVLDGMNSFRLKNGMYQHVKDNNQADNMATYQALLALEAVEAFRSEGRWIFTFE